jgi:cysteine desulfurase
MIWPLMDGGVQEHNKRAGAENLIGVIGMGVAAEAGPAGYGRRLDHLEKLKAKLLADLPQTLSIDEYRQHPFRSQPAQPGVGIGAAHRRVKASC